VNPYLALTGLLVLSAVMFMLPLIPALMELRRNSDASPLDVIPQHAGEIRYFADGFRNYIKALEPTLQDCLVSGGTATGTMPDGAKYLVLGRGKQALTLPLQQRDEICPVVIATASDLVLPPATTFSRDIYTGGSFLGGTENKYRAILAEKDAHLGQGSSVMRWVHAGGEFQADAECKLFARISSDTAIRLHPGSSFLRLNAPRIDVGPLTETADTENNSQNLPSARPRIPPRLLHDGDFEIGAGEDFPQDLVVRGKLRIGVGARVRGSVKSDQDMVVEPGAFVAGSLMSAKKVRIGSDCMLHGPVIAERELSIGTGTRCGTAESPTTVSAPRIEVANGVVVFGTLWAREQGQVVVKL